MKRKLLIFFATLLLATNLWAVSEYYPAANITSLAQSNSCSDGETAAKLFTNDIGDKWCSYIDASGAVAVWKTEDLFVLNRYDLTIGTDNFYFKGRNWRTWRVYGANFANEAAATANLTSTTGWTLIHEVVDDNQLVDPPTLYYPRQVCSYEFSNTKPFKYFKVIITANKGDGGGCIQMSEMALYGQVRTMAGAISISPTQKVCFAWGNLQYQASTNTWRFADHQYDYVGDATLGNVYENAVKCDNGLISSSYTGWIDLFGWATSGNSASGTAYQPWSTSTTPADYGPAISSGEWTPENSDWSVVNANQLGYGWRVLTKDEWVYIFYHRPNAANLFAFGTVNDVKGLIILPDNWSLPGGASFAPSTSLGLTDLGSHYQLNNSNCYTHNTYTADQWAVMEAAGAVFLPVTGYRSGTTVDRADDGVWYWSSTACSADGTYYMDVYKNGAFNTSVLFPQNNNPRCNAIAVRPGQIMSAVASVTTAASVTTSYFEWSEALAAWENNSTLTLLQDVTISSRIDVNNTRTLDLNGYGIKMTGGDCIFRITSDGDLTMIDCFSIYLTSARNAHS